MIDPRKREAISIMYKRNEEILKLKHKLLVTRRALDVLEDLDPEMYETVMATAREEMGE